jgi:hypothetical protein
VSEPLRWTRTALDARLEALQEKHDGQALIDAVVSFAETLTDEDRKVLQEALLDHAGRQATIDLGAYSRRRRRR